MVDLPSMAVSVRIQNRTLNGTASDIRHDRRIGHIPKYVDKDSISLNSEILRGPTPHKMRAACKKMRDLVPRKRKMRKDAAVSTRMIITFGKGLQPHFEALDVSVQDQLYREIAEAISDRLATSLMSLVAHRDETAPHAHGQLLAYTKYGLPISKVASPRVTSHLQDLAHQIALKYLPMCERGVKKERRKEREDDLSKIMNRSVKQLHIDLPKEILVKEVELDQLTLEIEAKKAGCDGLTSQVSTLAARAEEMQARVDATKEKMAGGEQGVERLQKRLTVYEQRLTDRQADLQSAEDQLGQLGAEIKNKEARKAELTGDVASLEEQAGQIKQDARRAVQEAEQAAQDEWASLEAIAGVVATLQPAYEAVRAIDELSKLDTEASEAVFASMGAIGHVATDVDADHWATALRMTDPFWALEVAPNVSRNSDPYENSRALYAARDEDYTELVLTMRLETGGREAVKAVAQRLIVHADMEKPTPLDESRLSKAITWTKTAFTGMKRGLGIAREAVSEKTSALAGVVLSLPEPTQQALGRLFGVKRDQAEKPAPDQTPSIFDIGP